MSQCSAPVCSCILKAPSLDAGDSKQSWNSTPNPLSPQKGSLVNLSDTLYAMSSMDLRSRYIRKFGRVPLHLNYKLLGWGNRKEWQDEWFTGERDDRMDKKEWHGNGERIKKRWQDVRLDVLPAKRMTGWTSEKRKEWGKDKKDDKMVGWMCYQRKGWQDGQGRNEKQG